MVLGWRSSDGRSGRLAVTLPTGEVFSGRFYEVDALPPPEGDESRSWPGVSPDPVEPVLGAQRTGVFVATLQGDRGMQLRCQLHAGNRLAGLLSGAEGRCRPSEGEPFAVRLSR